MITEVLHKYLVRGLYGKNEKGLVQAPVSLISPQVSYLKAGCLLMLGA